MDENVIACQSAAVFSLLVSQGVGGSAALILFQLTVITARERRGKENDSCHDSLSSLPLPSVLTKHKLHKGEQSGAHTPLVGCATKPASWSLRRHTNAPHDQVMCQPLFLSLSNFLVQWLSNFIVPNF